MSLLQQPTDTLYESLVLMSLQDIGKMAEVNNQYRQLIQRVYLDDNFWRLKYLHDYGQLPRSGNKSWRSLYLNTNIYRWVNYISRSALETIYIKNDDYKYPAKAVEIVTSGQLILYVDPSGVLYRMAMDSDRFFDVSNIPQYHNIPKPVELPFRVAKVAASSKYVCIIDEGGGLWYVGNLYRRESKKITKINLEFPVRQVVCSDDHLLILTESGRVYGMGINTYGQLGFGDRKNRAELEKLPITETITYIAGSKINSYFLDKNGRCWGCGSNGAGQISRESVGQLFRSLVMMDLPEPIKMISCAGLYSLFLDVNGAVHFMGQNYVKKMFNNEYYSADFLRGLPEIVKIVSNERFSALISVDDDLYVFGDTPKGEFLAPTKVDGIKAVDITATNRPPGAMIIGRRII